MNEIRAAWEQLQRRRFSSGWGGTEIAGVDLAELDAATAGCVSTFLSNRGVLDPERTAILRDCVKDLGVVVPRLSGSARGYFAQLQELACAVLQRCGRG